MYPHEEWHRGNLIVGEGCHFDVHCLLDLTGDITFGKYCMIGRETQIFTHDHHHFGRAPLLLLQEQIGIKWSSKKIGDDVLIHGAIILMQCEEIADGVVIGAGSVVTKSIVTQYEIWAGNPAVKVGER
jgi:maltose O-acetyltransferase